jgi:hypothetical protein
MSSSPGAGWLRLYGQQSRRPLTSLLFVLPILAVYEAGVLLLRTGASTPRNGVDAWLRDGLSHLGFGQYFLLPVLIVCILLAWHHTTGEPWRVRTWTLWGMLVESVLLAVVLLLVAQLHVRALASSSAFPAAIPVCAAPSGSNIGDAVAKLVSYFGAGIYEEVLFRLMLLPAIAAMLRVGAYAPAARWTAATVMTSIVFAAVHYVGPYGDSWDLASFLFRFTAGAFFCALFAYRGFGVTVGTHALYDVYAGLL